MVYTHAYTCPYEDLGLLKTIDKEDELAYLSQRLRLGICMDMCFDTCFNMCKVCIDMNIGISAWKTTSSDTKA